LHKESEINLIKVDVEGAEFEVLESSEEIVDKIQAWIVEIHDMKLRNKILNWFRVHNYNTRWLDYQHIFASRVRP